MIQHRWQKVALIAVIGVVFWSWMWFVFGYTFRTCHGYRPGMTRELPSPPEDPTAALALVRTEKRTPTSVPPSSWRMQEVVASTLPALQRHVAGFPGEARLEARVNVDAKGRVTRADIETHSDLSRRTLRRMERTVERTVFPATGEEYRTEFTMILRGEP